MLSNTVSTDSSGLGFGYAGLLTHFVDDIELYSTGQLSSKFPEMT